MLYYFAVALAFLSSALGYRIDSGSAAYRPLNPAPLRVVGGLAAILSWVLFVYGFWIAWYAPFAALGAGLVLYTLWAGGFFRLIEPPLFAMVSGVVSIILSVFVLLG